MKNIVLNDKNAKQLGRTLENNGIIRLILSGTGTEFEFTGKKLNITISCDETTLKNGNRCNMPRVAILADGRIIVKKVIEKQEKFSIIDSDNVITKKIRIVKLSEAAFSIAELYPAETDGNAQIMPTEIKNLKIEFIGDSITCGYGVDDSNMQSDFATEAENAMKSYGYISSELLDADYSLFSYSGYGIISGYTENGIRSTREILPPWYETFGFSYGSIEGNSPHNTDWDFSRFTPDVIVINLGTNDDSFCQKNTGAYQEFEDKYAEFIRTVRKNNPESKIIAALGIMEAVPFEHIENAVRKSGDKNIFTFRFRTQDGLLGFGSNWHPSEETQRYAAEELAEFIKCIIHN